MNFICKIIGHRWRYKDYSNWITNKGDKYAFNASRKCTRCKQNEYFYSAWIKENEDYKLDQQRVGGVLKKLPGTNLILK